MNLLKKISLIGLCFSLAFCTSDDQNEDQNNNNTVIDNSDFDVWSGGTLMFSKEVGSDPNLEENQDRISDLVWLTRSNNGGELFNAKEETSSQENISPTGTEWALGNTSTTNISGLNFKSLRQTISPQKIVDEDLILHLIGSDAYVDIKFSSWSRGGMQGNSGGFSYTRSTP